MVRSKGKQGRKALCNLRLSILPVLISNTQFDREQEGVKPGSTPRFHQLSLGLASQPQLSV